MTERMKILVVCTLFKYIHISEDQRRKEIIELYLQSCRLVKTSDGYVELQLRKAVVNTTERFTGLFTPELCQPLHLYMAVIVYSGLYYKANTFLMVHSSDVVRQTVDCHAIDQSLNSA